MDNKTFVERLSEGSGLDKDSISALIRSLGDILVDNALSGNVISIPSFGSFESKKKKERIAVHPSTAKRLLIPPKLTLVFKPSAPLRKQIREKRD